MSQFQFLPSRQQTSQSQKQESESQEQKRFSTQTDYGNSPPDQGNRPRGSDGGEDDEFNRLIEMLMLINDVLTRLVRLGERTLPKELYAPLFEILPELHASIERVIEPLQNRDTRSELRPQLVDAGLTGDMLGVKELSLKFHMDHVQDAILTYEEDESFLDRLLKKVKPGFKVMNSILGSLGIPGSEIAKEYKEHVEAAYEYVETES